MYLMFRVHHAPHQTCNSHNTHLLRSVEIIPEYDESIDF
jgi:hypothetical protein